MKELEKKISECGTVLPGNILKVDNFLNHQIDAPFMMSLGKEAARLFKDCGINKIVTIESSGIAFGVAIAVNLNVTPVVFARKSKTSNLSADVYSSATHSYTHGNDYNAIISKDYLSKNDCVLIADDFLAKGSAMKSLINLVEQSGAKLAGCVAVIEKGFQGGGDNLRAKGIHVESLAIIDSMDECTIQYRPE